MKRNCKGYLKGTLYLKNVFLFFIKPVWPIELIGGRYTTRQRAKSLGRLFTSGFTSEIGRYEPHGRGFLSLFRGSGWLLHSCGRGWEERDSWNTQRRIGEGGQVVLKIFLRFLMGSHPEDMLLCELLIHSTISAIEMPFSSSSAASKPILMILPL